MEPISFRFKTFQQMVDYNINWIKHPKDTSLISGTYVDEKTDLVSIDRSGKLIIEINQRGLLTTSSQDGIVENTYSERAYLSGFIETDRVKKISRKMNDDGFICLSIPVNTLIEVRELSKDNDAVEEYLLHTRIPVTREENKYLTFVGLMEEVHFLEYITPELENEILYGYSYIIFVDPTHGSLADDPKDGLYSKIIRYL